MAARLDVWCGMEEPECLFAHGLFRRTGEAGPVTASGGVRLLDGGLRPIPTAGPQPGPPVDAACEAAPQDRVCSHTATPRERAPRQEQI
jgi:hypothetical protein